MFWASVLRHRTSLNRLATPFVGVTLPKLGQSIEPVRGRGIELGQDVGLTCSLPDTKFPRPALIPWKYLVPLIDLQKLLGAP